MEAGAKAREHTISHDCNVTSTIQFKIRDASRMIHRICKKELHECRSQDTNLYEQRQRKRATPGIGDGGQERAPDCIADQGKITISKKGLPS
jgi:hypothetical protein